MSRSHHARSMGLSVLVVSGAVLLILALALALALTPGSALMTAAAQEEPTVVVGDATVDAGERVTVDVVLTEAPEGLAGYEVTVTLDGDADARVTGAEYPDAIELTSDPAIGTDGQSVRLEAADLSERIQPGATDVRLATVTVSAEGAGEPTATATASENGGSGSGASKESTSDGAPADEGANATPGADGPGFGALLALVVVALSGVALTVVRSR